MRGNLVELNCPEEQANETLTDTEPVSYKRKGGKAMKKLVVVLFMMCAAATLVGGNKAKSADVKILIIEDVKGGESAPAYEIASWERGIKSPHKTLREWVGEGWSVIGFQVEHVPFSEARMKEVKAFIMIVK